MPDVVSPEGVITEDGEFVGEVDLDHAEDVDGEGGDDVLDGGRAKMEDGDTERVGMVHGQGDWGRSVLDLSCELSLTSLAVFRYVLVAAFNMVCTC